MSALDIAREYIAHSWAPIPVPYKQKKPILKEWGTLRITADTAPAFFNGGPLNIGVLTGEPSGGLADVDLDCDEAVTLAPFYLPPTEAIFGRESRPRSHRLYTSPGISRDLFNDPEDKELLLELRGTAHQTVFPGSTHPSGETVEWQQIGEPATVDPERLQAATKRLAAAAMLLRATPQKGRHDLLWLVANALFRTLGDADTKAFLHPLARVVLSDRAREAVPEVDRLIAKAAERIRANQPVTGWPKLAEAVGEKRTAKLAEWLGVAREEREERPTWGAPGALPTGLPAVDPFDYSLLPLALRPWVQDIAERMQAPPDFAAVAVIVAMGATVGRQLAIRPKRFDDWRIVPNLWGGCIGRPGLMKTPAIQEALKPLYRLEIEGKADHEARMKLHAAEARLGAIEKKVREREIEATLKSKGSRDRESLLADLMESGEERPAPARKRYIINDSTVEKLGEILCDNPVGVLVYRDELTGWVRGLDREGRENDRGFYLEAWNGTGRYTYDRIVRGTVDIEAACVSMFGSIQPGPLAAYLGAMKSGGVADDGLLQRFQMLVWPDVAQEWHMVDRLPDQAARDRAFELFRSLSEIDPARHGGEAAFDGEIPFVHFDDEGQIAFDEWRRDLERRLRSGSLHPAFEAHLAKYRSLVPSLALIFHVSEGVNGPVQEVSCLRAIAWAEYLESHAGRIYSALLQAGEVAASEFGKRIAAGSLGEVFTAREVQRHGWAGLTDKEGIAEALELLEDLGWVASETTVASKGGRPKTRYKVNPAVAGERA
jgi:putative DNA primase/helicase